MQSNYCCCFSAIIIKLSCLVLCAVMHGLKRDSNVANPFCKVSTLRPNVVDVIWIGI